MHRTLCLLFSFTVGVSGCTVTQNNSGEPLSDYNADILQLETRGIKTILDKDNEEFRVKNRFEDTDYYIFNQSFDNETRMIRKACRSAQDTIDFNNFTQGVSEQEFDILDQEGELLEANKTVNVTKLTQYDLTEYLIVISDESSNISGECSIRGEQPRHIEVTIYSN